MSRSRGPSHDPILLDRLRRIQNDGFAFLPNRFLRGGFFEALSREELALYVLLIMVGDRNGVSYYGDKKLCSILKLSAERLMRARAALIRMDLVAFDESRYQVLSLPTKPLPQSCDNGGNDNEQRTQPVPAHQMSSRPLPLPDNQPETLSRDPSSQDDSTPTDMPEHVRHTLRCLWGPWCSPDKP